MHRGLSLLGEGRRVGGWVGVVGYVVDGWARTTEERESAYVRVSLCVHGVKCAVRAEARERWVGGWVGSRLTSVRL